MSTSRNLSRFSMTKVAFIRLSLLTMFIALSGFVAAYCGVLEGDDGIMIVVLKGYQSIATFQLFTHVAQLINIEKHKSDYLVRIWDAQAASKQSIRWSLCYIAIFIICGSLLSCEFYMNPILFLLLSSSMFYIVFLSFTDVVRNYKNLSKYSH